MLFKIGVFKNHLCWGLFLIKLQAWKPITLSKETPTQVFSCEYCKIFKNIHFEENMWTDASESGVICITKRFYRGLIFVKLSYLFQLSYILWKGIPENGTRDPGRLQVGPRDPWPGTPKCLSGTRDPGPQSGTQNPGPPKWDPGPGTPK